MKNDSWVYVIKIHQIFASKSSDITLNLMIERNELTSKFTNIELKNNLRRSDIGILLKRIIIMKLLY